LKKMIFVGIVQELANLNLCCCLEIARKISDRVDNFFRVYVESDHHLSY
jgi:hypothetical protein